MGLVEVQADPYVVLICKKEETSSTEFSSVVTCFRMGEVVSVAAFLPEK